jgi:hypothetical protein
MMILLKMIACRYGNAIFVASRTFENFFLRLVNMSSIMIYEEDSILPESSASQRVEQSSVSGLSKLKADPDSIGEYFIVKNTSECLEEAKRLLNKGPDSIYQLRDLFNSIAHT